MSRLKKEVERTTMSYMQSNISEELSLEYLERVYIRLCIQKKRSSDYRERLLADLDYSTDFYYSTSKIPSKFGRIDLISIKDFMLDNDCLLPYDDDNDRATDLFYDQVREVDDELNILSERFNRFEDFDKYSLAIHDTIVELYHNLIEIESLNSVIQHVVEQMSDFRENENEDDIGILSDDNDIRDRLSQ